MSLLDRTERENVKNFLSVLKENVKQSDKMFLLGLVELFHKDDHKEQLKILNDIDKEGGQDAFHALFMLAEFGLVYVLGEIEKDKITESN